jgi:hypothetical protein
MTTELPPADSARVTDSIKPASATHVATTPENLTGEALARRIEALPPIDRIMVLQFIEFLEQKRAGKAAATPRRSNLLDRERDFHTAFGYRLKAVRTGLGKTEQEGADAMGVKLKTYRLYEGGQPIRKNSGQRITDFAEAFGISIDWLVGRTGAMLSNGARPIRRAALPMGASDRTVIQFVPRGGR